MGSELKISTTSRRSTRPRGRRYVRRVASKQRIGMIATLATCVVTTVSFMVASPVQASNSGSTAKINHPASGSTHAKTPRDAASLTGYPSGVANAQEPSGAAPPSTSAMTGYTQSYVTDFSGSSLPKGWEVFTGTPGGDPGAQWSASHVAVSGGLLQLSASKDPAYGNRWVTGGLCQCGLSRVYGAYFVRSRATGAGPTQVESLWPVQGWPPEVDFNETFGKTDYSMATVHYHASNDQVHRTVNVDMTQWHTWGVIWSPNSITYTIDGNVWGVVTDPGSVPNQLMTLDLQQQTWCSANWACPSSAQTMQIDWVAEYTPSTATHESMVVSPFAAKSSTLTASLRSQIVQLALRIQVTGDSHVSLVGFSDQRASAPMSVALSSARAVAVKKYLARQLSLLGLTGVTVSAAGTQVLDSLAASATPLIHAMPRRVVASIG